MDPPLRLRGIEADPLPGVAQGGGQPVHGDLDRLGYEEGNAADLGGYYWPDEEKTNAVMRPSATFNKIIDTLEK